MDIDLDVLQKNLFSLSEPVPDDVAVVRGYDFNEGINYEKLFESFQCTGFQATNLGLAIKEVNEMLKKRTPVALSSEEYERDELAPRKNCTIFLGFTSNMISSGVREVIRFLVQHKLVDCVVTTAGGIEEDIIKCLAPTHIGDFQLEGKLLREKGLNRIGNLLVPNKNYCLFEDWLLPILDTILQEQSTESLVWSPSKLISRLGQEINNPDSICYWAHKNNIPIFSPAITDGSLGDIMYFHSIRSPGLIIDILQDLRKINTIAVKAVQTGMIILGGGLVKHHVSNANLMRNGADHAVFINTGNEFDGSDSGARPDEAVSWGKIQKEAKPVKVFGDATIMFPIMVSQTFAKYHQSSHLV